MIPLESKKILLLLGVIIFCIPYVLAQKSQKLIMVKGDTLDVNVSNISDDEITYSLIGQTITRTTEKKNIREIIYADGKSEIITAPKLSKQNLDWEKVTFTTNPDDVKGMIKIGEIEGVGKSAMGGEGSTRPKAEKAIKIKAAENGASIIYIISQNFSQGTISNSTIIKGNAYKSASDKNGKAIKEKISEQSPTKETTEKNENTQTSIVVNGKDDWEKVTFTTNPDDVRGLTNLGEVKGVGKSAMGGEGSTRPKAEKAIKVKAAEMGAFIIYINSQNFSQGAISNSTIIIGNAYGK